MKEITIIVGLIILIVIVSLFTQKYLDKSSEDFIIRLDELKTNLKENDKTLDDMKSFSEDIYSEWKNLNEKWSIIVLHEELDLIEISLVEMRASIEINELGKGIKEIEKAIALINHITEKEKVAWKNIF